MLHRRSVLSYKQRGPTCHTLLHVERQSKGPEVRLAALSNERGVWHARARQVDSSHPMLLTLSTRSLAERNGQSDLRQALLDMPAFALRELSLRGLFVPAAALAGWTPTDLDELRERADKAACPCLVLVEETPLLFASMDPEEQDAAAERTRRLAFAAHRLGCNAIGLSVAGPDSDEAFDMAAAAIKDVMRQFERLELNVLLAPAEGLTFDPDRLTDLIKRIGGFRIGSLPSFGHAADTGDVEGTLRKLAPYAGAMFATVRGFGSKGDHLGYDLEGCVRTIRSVGFVNTLAIDYVPERGKKKASDDPCAVIEQARTMMQSVIDES